ncbi:uridine kinase [Alkaliphilus hydrothermalis]|uniref:Uridine kinase n=1 Tax=Alkaliphilus hydrothermalis TaxID=1482730 RepID=A0ABS2NRC0_9FIRM|nr:uridine kinase [Alkaliphilus hydrothermalis]MBM7615481.1 uridine kinase [Alkaliphilus hydrothermalis]
MKQPVIIGIAGGTGSGKTTLARKLKEDFEDDLLLLCQDYYYRSFNDITYEERCKLNFDHPNAFDTDLLVEHIAKLKNFEAIERPVYSFVEHMRQKETVYEEAKRVVVLEGILIFENPKLVNLMDIKVFVDTDSDIRFARRLVRDINERGRNVDSVVDQYLNTVKPMHEAFIEPSKKNADIIIPEGGMNQVASSMLVDKINTILNNW